MKALPKMGEARSDTQSRESEMHPPAACWERSWTWVLGTPTIRYQFAKQMRAIVRQMKCLLYRGKLLQIQILEPLTSSGGPGSSGSWGAGSFSSDQTKILGGMLCSKTRCSFLVRYGCMKKAKSCPGKKFSQWKGGTSNL